MLDSRITDFFMGFQHRGASYWIVEFACDVITEETRRYKLRDPSKISHSSFLHMFFFLSFFLLGHFLSCCRSFPDFRSSPPSHFLNDFIRFPELSIREDVSFFRSISFSSLPLYIFFFSSFRSALLLDFFFSCVFVYS